MSQRTKSAAFFLIGNGLAGILHYLYQVQASRALTTAQFADLNSWIAYITLFLLAGTLLQVQANFVPVGGWPLRIVSIATVFSAVFATYLWGAFGKAFSMPQAFVIVIIGAGLGWLLGQAQSRMRFFSMTIANLLVAATKLGLLAAPLAMTPVDLYSFAMMASYLPGLTWLAYVLWNDRDVASAKPRRGWRIWAAPLMIASAGALIPSMDMILIERIESADVFQIFARSVIFYKGVYFVVFNVAQLLLPAQLRGEASGARIRNPWTLLLAITAGAALIGLTGPAFARHGLGWTEVPPSWMVFISCFNIALLAWFFVRLQQACASHHLRPAAQAFGLLLFEIALQSLGLWHLAGYYICALTLQGLILFLILRPTKI